MLADGETDEMLERTLSAGVVQPVAPIGVLSLPQNNTDERHRVVQWRLSRFWEVGINLVPLEKKKKNARKRNN